MKDTEFLKLLKGRKIVDVRRLSKEEMERIGWHSNPLVLMFDDGSILIPQSDDEGNDGGAMMYINDDENPTIIFVR